MLDNKKMKYIFYACLGVIVIGCFLPFITILGVSTNFVFYEGNIKDGVFVIILAIMAFIFVLKNKYLGALISQSISVGVLMLDYFDYKSKLNELGSYFTSVSKFGVGFYVVLIGLVLSLAISILLYINMKKTKSANNGIQTQNTYQNITQQNVNTNQFSSEYNQNYNNMVNNQQNNITNQNMVQPQNNMYCQNCGSVRDQNSLFCNNCGMKF